MLSVEWENPNWERHKTFHVFAEDAVNGKYPKGENCGVLSIPTGWTKKSIRDFFNSKDFSRTDMEGRLEEINYHGVFYEEDHKHRKVGFDQDVERMLRTMKASNKFGL